MANYDEKFKLKGEIIEPYLVEARYVDQVGYVRALSGGNAEIGYVRQAGGTVLVPVWHVVDKIIIPSERIGIGHITYLWRKALAEAQGLPPEVMQH